MKLNLKAEGEYQELVLKYLEDNASDVLAEKINSGAKTLNDCWNFITEAARKKAKSGCACMSDTEVYGLAIHFFEEDSIKIDSVSKAISTLIKAPKVENPKKIEKVVEKKSENKVKRSDAELPGQMTFDMLFGGV